MTDRSKKIVYFNNWVAAVGPELLQRRTDIRLQRLTFDQPEAEIWSALGQAHGYNCLPRTEGVARWFPTREVVARAPNLLAVCSAGAGYDVVDVDACTEAGIIVCNQSGTNREAVAEHALGLMLSLSKRIAYWDREMRRTPKVDRFHNLGNDLKGKTIGIVGIGQIGGRLAEFCRMFPMQVLACDPYLSAEQVAAKGATKVEFAELLRRADFVSLNVPLTKETRGMFGAREFAQMKPTAYFITTARGPVHDEAALVEALKTGRIAGAGVDVFHTEPVPLDHPLLALENALVTPHMGGINADALNETATAAAHQWMDIFDGKVPPRLVNPEAWLRYSKRFEEILGFRPQALA